MSKRNYYTTPYSSFELGIHREFPIPVPVKTDITRDDLELYVGHDGQLQYFATAAMAAAAPLLEKLPIVGKIADAASKLLDKVGLGGSDQDRFIKRYYEIKDIFKSNGYSDVPLGDWLDKYNIRKTDVKNNQKQPYWAAAFSRLRLMTIDWLNYKNPGLGTAYAELFPEFKMANEGQMIGEPIAALKEIVKAFPPGTYKGGAVQAPKPAYKSATGSNGVQSLLASSAGRPFEDGGDEDETKEAHTKQVVTYVTVGLAVVLLIIAVVVKLKEKSA